jgi:hypothetical protein
MQAQIDVVKKDKEALQNKTQVVQVENAALRVELTEVEIELKDVRSALYQFSNKTETNIQQITLRLEQCEAKSTTFAEIMEHRRTQEQSSVCGSEALENMLAVCCDSGGPAGNGHRLLQNGCDSLPPMCSLQCSAQFILIFENCQGQPLMERFSAEDVAQWTAFYGQCQEVEQATAEMGVLQSVSVRMFQVQIDTQHCTHAQQVCWAHSRCCGHSQCVHIAKDSTCECDDGWTGPNCDQWVSPSPPPPSAPNRRVCTSQNILTCVPTCNSTTHGYELLATIDGTDTKFSCSLANMLFSWLGAAALGGFLGQNVVAFVSAVISGAAGTYVLTLTEDADVATDLVVQPGQNVIISGDAGLAEPPSWGSGIITVQQFGTLMLTDLVMTGSITAEEGGIATVSGGSLAYFGSNVDVSSSTTLTLDSQCYLPYITLNDAWRAASSGVGDHCDALPTDASYTNVGGGRWYRFEGVGGDALPLTHPGAQHCGTGYPGWLSGWDATITSGDPPSTYSTIGRYPTAREGVVEMTACFVSGQHPCYQHTAIGVVRCSDFLLWRLPYAACTSAYCTTSSGL